MPDAAIKLISTLDYKFAVGGFSRKDRSIHPQDPDLFNLPRIYPYSNPVIYLVINGANGATFDQLVMDSIQARP